MAVVTVTVAQTESPNHYAVAVEKQSFDGRYTPSSIIVTLSVALALYNSLEMILLISLTFKRRRGLYFWSLALCNFGVFAYTTGMMLGFFELCILWLSKSWLDVGWVCMIVCQSLVLYSRLGLILDNVKILMGVKWMIVVNSLIFLVPTVILDFGSTYSGLPSFSEAYYYMEHIQMTGVTLQELIISSLYLWKTTSLLKVISRANSRSMIWQLFTINIIIICMDVSGQQIHLRARTDILQGRAHHPRVQASPALPRKHQGLRLQRQAEARVEHPIQACQPCSW